MNVFSANGIYQAARRDRAALSEQMRPVPVADGPAIRCARVGAGSPIVCLPMVAEANFVYAPQIQALSERHELIIYDPRLSRSTRVTVADRAREVLLLLDGLGIPAAHVLAWSDTGAAGYEFAKTWPGRCLSLCCIGLADRYTFPPPVSWLADAMYRRPARRLPSPVVLRMLLAHYLGGAKAKKRWIRRELKAIPQFDMLFKHSVLPNIIEHRPVHGEVSVPALVICGDRDALLTVAQARRMAELIGPACHYRTVTGGEHFLTYATPLPVNEALTEFYSALEPERET